MKNSDNSGNPLVEHNDDNWQQELRNHSNAVRIKASLLNEQSPSRIQHKTANISELESEGRRLVETVNQSTSIIKIISEKNKLIGSNAKHTIDSLKQQLDTAKKDFQNLQNSNMSESIKLTVQLKKISEQSETLRNELDKSRNEIMNLQQQINKLENDSTNLTAENLSLLEELERTRNERDMANYWLQAVSNEINENLATVTKSAELSTLYEEEDIISTSQDYD